MAGAVRRGRGDWGVVRNGDRICFQRWGRPEAPHDSARRTGL
jgi:hypothetical protein